MEREELRTTLVNHLETLRRNLQVVSMEVLKTKYKKPFDALRQDICKAATAYTHFLVFDGMRIKHKYFDEAVPYIDTAVKQPSGSNRFQMLPFIVRILTRSNPSPLPCAKR